MKEVIWVSPEKTGIKHITTIRAKNNIMLGLLYHLPSKVENRIPKTAYITLDIPIQFLHKTKQLATAIIYATSMVLNL